MTDSAWQKSPFSRVQLFCSTFSVSGQKSLDRILSTKDFATTLFGEHSYISEKIRSDARRSLAGSVAKGFAPKVRPLRVTSLCSSFFMSRLKKGRASESAVLSAIFPIVWSADAMSISIFLR